MPPSTSHVHSRRQLIKTLASATILGPLVGCSDNPTDGTGGTPSDRPPNTPANSRTDSPHENESDPKDEVDELAEQALQDKETARRAIGSAIQHAQEETWDECLGDLKGVDGKLEAARQNAEQARQLADSSDYPPRTKALTVLLDLIDRFTEVQTELRSLCEAGSRGNQQEVGDRWESIRALVTEIEQKEKELDRIMQENTN